MLDSLVQDSSTSSAKQNGFIITWILHKIIMFSNKVELEAGQNDTLNPPPYPIPSLPPYLMTSHNFSNVG